VSKKVIGFRDENIRGLSNRINEFIESEDATLCEVRHEAHILLTGKEIYTAMVIYECP
jgi:hypothetical protein